MRVVSAALAAAALVGTSAAAGAPGDGRLDLPAPIGSIPVPSEVFTDRPERLRESSVPGRLTNDERIDVRLGPDGVPRSISAVQRIVLTGTGDYVVRERATATSVEALDDTPAPVLQRSAVVWQGFVPGRRELAARITLDPVVEAPRLPLGVVLAWQGNLAGPPHPVNPDGTFAEDTAVIVRLSNQTARPVEVETGDAPAAAVAGLLDELRETAESEEAVPPPMAGRTLPAVLAGGRETAVRTAQSVAPLRVTGEIRVEGGSRPGSVTGPATTPLPDGARVDGVLAQTAEFTVQVPAGGRLRLDLDVVPALDPRLLAPPRGASWAAWARQSPSAADRAAAFDLLTDTLLSAARIDEYMPYLGHHGPGSVTTRFTYGLAEPEVVVAPEPPLRPKPVPIAITLAGVVALAGAGAAAWRRA